MKAQELLEHLREANDVGVTVRWESYTANVRLPEIEHIWVHYRKPNPELWKFVATQVFEGFTVTITGTRHQPHDGLDPEYRALLEEVNAKRKELNLQPVLP